jgi:membrane-associated protein
LSLAATITGDYSAYLAANYFKKPLDVYIEKKSWIKSNIKRADNTFKKYGLLTIFFTRFAFSGTGPYVNILSGLRGLRKWGFLKAVIAGEIIYTLIFVSVGYFFRETWQAVIIIIKDYTAFAVLLLLGLFIFYRIIKLVINHRKNRL